MRDGPSALADENSTLKIRLTAHELTPQVGTEAAGGRAPVRDNASAPEDGASLAALELQAHVLLRRVAADCRHDSVEVLQRGKRE